MTNRKKRIDPDNPLKELNKLMRKLGPEQGMVARRNARAAVCAELRRVRSFIDKEYPVLTTKKPRKKRKTGQAKAKELSKQGWVQVTEKKATTLAEAGIRPKIVKWKEYLPDLKKYVDRTLTFVPGWAIEMLNHPKCNTAMLSKARRSSAYRKEVLMENRLQNPHLRLVTA